MQMREFYQEKGNCVFHLRTLSEEYEMVNVGNKLCMRTDLETTKESATIAVTNNEVVKEVQFTFLCYRS